MTFHHISKHFSSDDELDRALNAWVNGSRHSDQARDGHSEHREESRRALSNRHSDDERHESEESRISLHAIEFHQWAGSALGSEPATTGPAAGTWNTVLRQTAQPTSKGRSTMSSATLSSSGTGFTLAPDVPFRERASRFAHLAATIALVFAIAAGGWLVMSQMPGGNGRFAALQGTPEDSAQTCNVEPMKVDEVIAIAENPYSYLSEEQVPASRGADMTHSLWQQDYVDVRLTLARGSLAGQGNEPTQAAFDQSSDVLNQYVACMQHDGTVAMQLRFSDPISIQYHIQQQFPFYRSEEQVRDYVNDWLQQADNYQRLSFDWRGDTLTFRLTDQKNMAVTHIHDFGLGFDQVIYIGSEVYDDNGEFLGYYHPDLRQTWGSNGELLDFGVVFTLVHSRYTGEWYLVTEQDWLNPGD